MNIREFDITTDAPGVAALFGQLGYPVSVEALLARAASSESGSAIVLVAENRDGVIGVLAMHVVRPWHEAGRWAIVSALVVDEQVRGSGAGTLLLTAAEAAARTEDCSHIELSSSESRLRAHVFYGRSGFAEVRKRFVKRLLV